MKNNNMYSGYRYPAPIISHTVPVPKTFHRASFLAVFPFHSQFSLYPGVTGGQKYYSKL